MSRLSEIRIVRGRYVEPARKHQLDTSARRFIAEVALIGLAAIVLAFVTSHLWDDLARLLQAVPR